MSIYKKNLLLGNWCKEIHCFLLRVNYSVLSRAFLGLCQFNFFLELYKIIVFVNIFYMKRHQQATATICWTAKQLERYET